MIELIHGDCLEEMKKIPDGSVDLTVTSPPYDNLRTYNGNNAQWGEAVWKSVIEELYTVTKPGGVVVWVVGDATIKGSETGTSFKQALWAKECGFNLHDTMIWRKSNAMPTDKRHRYSQCFEYMFVWTKGKVSTFNALTEPARTHRTYKSNWGRKDDKMIHGVGKKRQTNAFKIRDNVFTYAISKGGATNDTIAWKHNAIYPEQLAHDHIISWSNEGDTVLDPFMGSGTTGKMAKQLNRNFIGIELDKEYYEIAKARIN